MPGIKARYAIPLVLAALAAGCGSDSSNETTPDVDVVAHPREAAVKADGAEDQEIGLEVRHYFARNCTRPGALERFEKEHPKVIIIPAERRVTHGSEALCSHLATIEVDDSRVTVRADLAGGALGAAAGDAYCLLIQGSDVADFTPGHELQDLAGETIKACPTRTE